MNNKVFQLYFRCMKLFCDDVQQFSKQGHNSLGSLENLKYKYCIGSVIDHSKVKEKKC